MTGSIMKYVGRNRILIVVATVMVAAAVAAQLVPYVLACEIISPLIDGETPEVGFVVGRVVGIAASGGKYVGYMTEEGANVTFQIVSDAEVSDATIVLRLSKELGDYTFDTSNYSIELNAKPLQFSPIEFKNVPSQDGASDVSNCYALPFQDFVIAENVTLEEGLNSISCTVMNSDAIAGTTITANGPLIDCLKITTSAVLDWSAANGLPMYY